MPQELLRRGYLQQNQEQVDFNLCVIDIVNKLYILFLITAFILITFSHD